MADLLAYHTPETLHESAYQYRRPAVLVSAAVCLVGGAGLMYLGVGRWPRAMSIDRWVTAGLGVLLAAAGAWLTYAYAARRARVSRFTTDGVHCPRLRPWSKIARVGGVRGKHGIQLELTLDYYSAALGHAYGRCTLPADRRLSDAEFDALCDTLDAVGEKLFPHVWIDRVVEARSTRDGGVSLRVLAELEKRPRRR